MKEEFAIRSKLSPKLAFSSVQYIQFRIVKHVFFKSNIKKNVLTIRFRFFPPTLG